MAPWLAGHAVLYAAAQAVSLARQHTQVLRRNVKRFRGGLVFKAHRIFVSLNSRLESNKEKEETTHPGLASRKGLVPEA